MLHLEVLHDRLTGKDFFKEHPQSGDVPLPVSKIIDKLPFSCFPTDAKRVVEGSASCLDAKGVIEHNQWFAHRIDNALRVSDRFAERGFYFALRLAGAASRRKLAFEFGNSGTQCADGVCFWVVAHF